MRALGRTALVIIILCSTALCAGAQPVRSWELAGGYTRANDSPNLVTLNGWLADGGVRITPWLAAIVEASDVRTTIVDVTLRTASVVAGPRAAARIGPFVEFVQLTSGWGQFRSTVFDETTSDNHLLLQPGGGLDVPFKSRFAARFQVDRRMILGGELDAQDRHQLRLAVCLVVLSRP
ncbi:MAG TPA: hypothetical protein VEU08_16565 [Vicinamibacterales bacterium]|nr:hypothetical protein [Vicinamibacterales bacterium]